MEPQSVSYAGDTQALMQTYLEHLLSARRQQAFSAVLNALDSGMPVTTVYLDVIQPAMYELGRLWQTDAIDIATEHYCTAATQVLLAQIFPMGLNRPSKGFSMMGSCLGSELHELGMRVVCDFFEFSGWDTFFTGAVTPPAEIAAIARSRKFDALCFSASLASGVPLIRAVVRDIRHSLGDATPAIIVGGLAFLINPQLYKAVGADATAPDARGAVQVAEQLLLSRATHV